jgi:hypothetical protein
MRGRFSLLPPKKTHTQARLDTVHHIEQQIKACRILNQSSLFPDQKNSLCLNSHRNFERHGSCMATPVQPAPTHGQVKICFLASPSWSFRSLLILIRFHQISCDCLLPPFPPVPPVERHAKSPEFDGPRPPQSHLYLTVQQSSTGEHHSLSEAHRLVDQYASNTRLPSSSAPGVHEGLAQLLSDPEFSDLSLEVAQPLRGARHSSPISVVGKHTTASSQQPSYASASMAPPAQDTLKQRGEIDISTFREQPSKVS